MILQLVCFKRQSSSTPSACHRFCWQPWECFQDCKLLVSDPGQFSNCNSVDWINTRSQSVLTVKHFRLIQLVISLGLILSIAGGSSSGSANGGTPKISTTSKAGIILFIVGFVGILLVWLATMPQTGVVPGTEKRIPIGVIIAMPFILVRLIYSVLTVFVHNHTFNVLDGSVVVHVVMAVLEEFIVVGIYLVLGFMLNPLSQTERGPIATRAWKQKNDPQRSSSRQRRSREGRSSQRHHHHSSNDRPVVQYPPQGHHAQPVYPDQDYYVPANEMRLDNGHNVV
jgi:hypothetical protein